MRHRTLAAWLIALLAMATSSHPSEIRVADNPVRELRPLNRTNIPLPGQFGLTLPRKSGVLRIGPMSSTMERYTVAARANRGGARIRTNAPTSTTSTAAAVKPAPAPASAQDDAFWKRLSMCENPSGNAYGGYFQFTDPGTAKKAGYVPGSSYADQLAAAKRWAAIIRGREGTTAGWPHCWWVALRG